MKFFSHNAKIFFNTYLVLIILIGIFFRFVNLNWDKGYFFNPDESNNIAHPAASLEYPYKPQKFTYGTLTIYTYRLAGNFVSAVTGDNFWITAAGINIVGRFISASLSVLIILITYFIGKNIFNQFVGLLAATFTSFNVGLIQAAHFGTTETILSLVAITLVYLFTKEVDYKDKKKIFFHFGLIGFILSLGISAKISALVFLPLVVFYYLSNFKILKWKGIFLYSFFGFLISGLVFFLTNPYSFISFKDFWESFKFESQIASGVFPVFYTVQFQDTVPFIFQFKNIFPYTNSLPVLICCAFGLTILIFQLIKNKDYKILSLILLPLFYFVYNGSLFVKWTRYTIPLNAFISIFSAFFLYMLWQKIKVKTLAVPIIFLTIIFGFLHTFNFTSIYLKPDVRITASSWMNKNLPANSKLLLEPYDVVEMPLKTENFSKNFEKEYFDFYYIDEGKLKKNEKAESLAKVLANNQFFITASRRVFANYQRFPDKYYITSRFYKNLFEDKLGYYKIAEFNSSPGYNDDKAEETFQVFDHPKVMIYKNTKQLSVNQLKEILLND